MEFSTYPSSAFSGGLQTELSSGEKIILSLFSSLNFAAATDELKILPKILLLDEVDGSLHPAMVKYLLRSLEIMCDEKDIHVILTTHSPTTIALSNDESVHVLENNKREKASLHQTSTDKAVRLLTDGIPLLSVKQELRRLVFVEGKSDVSYYEDLYAIYLTHTNDRDDDSAYLSFVSSAGSGTGNRDIVRQQVCALREAGNKSIYGINDWDKKEDETKSVLIPGLENSRRYSLENYQFDLLAVGMYLLHEGHVAAEEIGLEAGTTYSQIKTSSKEVLSKIAENIMSGILPKKVGTNTRLCKYGKAKEIEANIPVVFLELDDNHSLEKLIKTKYDIQRTNFRDDLISVVYKHHPEMIPKDIIVLFERLETAACND